MSSPEITAETYPAALEALTTVARSFLAVTEQIDIAQMRALCARHQATAPVLEPTAYQRGGDANLTGQDAFLAATEEYLDKLRALDHRPDKETRP